MITPTPFTREPRSRVQDMLKQKRTQHTSSHTLIEHMPNYSQAYARTNMDVQHGGGHHTQTNHASKNTDIAICACVVIVLTVMFVCVGEYVDNYLLEYEDETTDNGTEQLISILVFQMIFNVIMLVVPYIVLHMYAKDSLAYQYYLVVAAFWVLSLQAQPQLRRRFEQLLRDKESQSMVTPLDEDTDTHEDTKIISEHFAEAENQHKQEVENIQYRQNQVERMTEQQPVYRHDIPMQFNSQNLMPAAVNNLNRETNLADLF